MAHCQLRNDQRTFKLDRIVRVVQMDMPPLVVPARAETRGGAKIYDAPENGAQIYNTPEPIQLASLSLDIDLPVRSPSPTPSTPSDLTIPTNPS